MRERAPEPWALLLSRLQQSNAFSSAGRTGAGFESVKAPLLSQLLLLSHFLFWGLLLQNDNASLHFPSGLRESE